MPQHMTTSSIRLGFVDKRKLSGNNRADSSVHVEGQTAFVANDDGTTTTLVGDNAAPATGVNVVRIGDKFVIRDGDDVLKEKTIFRVTGVAVVSAVTTVTFAPAAAVATEVDDYINLTGTNNLDDIADLDAALTAKDSTTYTAKRLKIMNVNDKVFAVRRLYDASGF